MLSETLETANTSASAQTCSSFLSLFPLRSFNLWVLLFWLFWWKVDTLSCAFKCFSFHFALQIVQSQGSRSSLFCLQCYVWLPSLPFSGNWSFLSAFNQFSRFKCHHSRLWLFSEATQLFNICSVGAEGGTERLLQAKYINWEKGFRKKAMQKGVDFFFSQGNTK